MKTTEEIYREMAGEYTRLTGIALHEGGDMAIRFWAAAAQIYSLWLHEQFVLRQVLPQTAEGEHLDRHAQLRGIGRTSAQAATGTLRFYLGSAGEDTVRVPKGAVCATEAGTAFETTQAGTIPPGELYCEVPAAARAVGIGGNVPAGSITRMMLPPAGVTRCLNPLDFAGGLDTESDASLRSRVVYSYRRLPNGANKAYYEIQALNTDGVAAVSVIPKARGVGTVDVVIAGEAGIPEPELVARVAAELNSQREICVSLLVEAPTRSTVDLSLAVKAAQGKSFGSVRTAVERNLRAHFNGELLGRGVLRAKLGNIVFDTEGVENYVLLSPDADVTPDARALPVLGSVQISEMG